MTGNAAKQPTGQENITLWDPCADFTLPNENNISKGELNSRPTGWDIATYVKLYRQEIIPIQYQDFIPLMFIRNDIVKYIQQLDENNETGLASRALTNRLQQLGIMQYVHLNCKLDIISPNFPVVYLDKPEYELIEGKYERPVIP